MLSLALVAFISLGLAEEGSRGGGLQIPPDAPLPFQRHRIFGLNLAEMSSFQALEWLNAAGNPSMALIVLPIDADVVESLAQDDQRDAALAAIDTLRNAAGGSPLAVCLRRPAEIGGGSELADAAVDAITTRFPDQVVYVRACDPDEFPGWQSHIDGAARPDAEVSVAGNALIPLGGDGVVLTERIDSVNELDAEHFRLHARGYYTVFLLSMAEAMSAEDVQRAAEALADTSHSALILVSPVDGVDPSAVTSSIGSVALAGTTLPEGFSGVGAPAMTLNDQWQSTTVGTVDYLRTTSSTAALSVEFIGTDAYLSAIESPESGVVNVWIDPDSPTAKPTVVLNLDSRQARDAAIPIAQGLSAARHQLILQTVNDEGQSVAISGIFVTGKPATAWAGTMAAAVVLLAAVVALSERCYAAINAIRRHSSPPRRRHRTGHPRVFARD